MNNFKIDWKSEKREFKKRSSNNLLSKKTLYGFSVIYISLGRLT
jgi:hypothetical protein